jgi:beta-glucosidase
LYIGYLAAANEPPKLLKGFQRISLSPGACGGVGFEVAAKDLLVWGTWLLVPGEYKLLVGSSSRDIRLTGVLAVTSA